MSARFLRHGAVWAGVMLLALGLAAARGPGDEDNPFAASKTAEAKSAPQPPKKAEADPFGAAANPFDPFAARRKPDAKPAAGKPAKAPATSGRRLGSRGATGPRGVTVEPGAAEAAIEKALAGPVEEFEFDQTPLIDVIAQLQKSHRINIFLDAKALEGVSIDPKTTMINMSLKGISLRSALELMLSGQGLTWMIDREVLYITTPDEADQFLITRVYDVADLVRCRDEKDVLWDDYDSLIDAIENCIQVDSWSDTGAGQGSIIGQTFGGAHVLIVSNTRQNHERIAKLLEEIRKVAAKAGPDQKPPLRRRPNLGPPAGQPSGKTPAPGGMGYM